MLPDDFCTPFWLGMKNLGAFASPPSLALLAAGAGTKNLDPPVPLLGAPGNMNVGGAAVPEFATSASELAEELTDKLLCST